MCHLSLETMWFGLIVDVARLATLLVSAQLVVAMAEAETMI